MDGNAYDVGPGFGVHAVAVAPVGEGATELDIAEVLVPDELRDLCLPGDTDGGVGEGAEANGHAGASSGGEAFEAEGWVGGYGLGRRWGEGCFFDAGLLPGGHEAWEVFRIAKEGKDDLNGVGQPLFGAEGVTHSRNGICAGGLDGADLLIARKRHPIRDAVVGSKAFLYG